MARFFGAVEELKMLMLAMQQQLAGLKGQVRSLRASDRRQWKRLRMQHRLSLAFLGLMAVGGALMFGGLEAEDKVVLERIATGVLATSLAGLVGVNLKDFDPGDDDDAD